VVGAVVGSAAAVVVAPVVVGSATATTTATRLHMSGDEAVRGALCFDLDCKALAETAEARDALELRAGSHPEADLVPTLGLDLEAVVAGVLGDDGAVDMPDRRLRRECDGGKRQDGHGREGSDAFAEHESCLSCGLAPG
jgi:hypothetical protein